MTFIGLTFTFLHYDCLLYHHYQCASTKLFEIIFSCYLSQSFGCFVHQEANKDPREIGIAEDNKLHSTTQQACV